MMKKDQITIPAALQLVTDDVGWMIGRDQRWENHPSRTGMPRRHVLEDYIALNEVGRTVNMKVLAPLVLGEWDKNNILRRVPYSNKYGENWDSAPFLDYEEAEKIRDYVNSSEYIEPAIHGLLHDVWYNGENIGGQEYFIPEGYKRGGNKQLAPPEFLRSHLDAFFEIYQSWGFTKKIRGFVSPGGPNNAWETNTLASIVKEYGVLYWCNHRIEKCIVQNGIIINNKTIVLAPWEAYDLDPDTLPAYTAETAGIIGGHWPNLLRYNPALNLERLDAWKRFFERQAEVFGIILSRDIEFAEYQQLYKYYSNITEQDGMIIIDLSDADKQKPAGPCQPLYISVRNGITPVVSEGGTLSLYETMQNFSNYRIDRAGARIVIA